MGRTEYKSENHKREQISTGYGHTIRACFTGYVVQAAVNNFIPLLFLTFQETYKISLADITLLIIFNFGVQLITDLASTLFIDKIGYRISLIAAHVFSAIGLAGLAVFPEVLPNPLTGLVLAVCIYAVGGGLIEVLVSPVVEACPTKHKESMMSLLHSFYSWGQVGVVLLSTLFFGLAGIENWKILAVLWAMIPIANAFVFTKVPIVSLQEQEENHGMKQLFSNKTFWILLLMMVCAGASEHAVNQWASTYAEAGLKVSKTVGDLAGPMMFAVCMGTARLIYGKMGEKIGLEKFMCGSLMLCVMGYLLAGLTQNAVIGLIGCGICGFSVGILWPGTFSTAASAIKGGGTAMFALLALGGDLGCAGGPALVGRISEMLDGNLGKGILAAVIFPVIMLFIFVPLGKRGVKKSFDPTII